MKSYVKLYGPDFLKALEKLEKATEEDPVITGEAQRLLMEPAKLMSPLTPDSQRVLRTICSDWTISFEWQQEPSLENVKTLIEKIDRTLLGTKARYSITTVSDPLAPPIPEDSVQIPSEITSPYAITFFKFIGPPISKIFEIFPRIIRSHPSVESGSLLSREGGPQLGIFDYALVWSRLPTPMELRQFLETIDRELGSLGIMYDVVTRSYR